MPSVESPVVHSHWTGFNNDLHRAYSEIKSGSSEIGHEVIVRARVDKVIKNTPLFRLYSVVDHVTSTLLPTRIICDAADYEETDGMTFDEMHDDIEVGDIVQITGYPHRSIAGNLCIYSSFMEVHRYGNDKYDSELSSDENSVLDSEDGSYVPSENSEGEEDESEFFCSDPMDIKETVEETDEETDDETDDSRNIFFPNIPLTVYHNHMLYCGRKIRIESTFLDEPFKVGITTREGIDFSFSKMGHSLIGVVVPNNSIESSRHRYGYDIVVDGSFTELMKVLQ